MNESTVPSATTPRVCIVTGAARGIGEATARLFAARGHRVAVLDKLGDAARSVASDIEGGGGRGLAIACDVSRRADVEAAIEQTERDLGAIEVVVNNAGVGGPFHRVDEVSDEEWDWIIGTNLKSVFLFARNVLPKMRARGFGRIVNVASIQGLQGSVHSSTYVASKHGMIGYTKTIAAEWGAHGITCNAVCPGYVDTAMGVQPDKVQDYLARVLAKSPVPRVAQPDEVASLIAYLSGDDAGYINGASFVIDGGITSHIGIT